MPRFAALLSTLLALGLLAGCGGGQVAYTEVESAPPTLPIPQDKGTAVDTAADDTTTDADGVTTKKTDDSATTTTGTSTGTTTTAPSTSTGTTTAPSTSTGTTTVPSTSTGTSTGGGAPSTGGGTTTTPPTETGGANGGAGLDQFCADNPGACNGGN